MVLRTVSLVVMEPIRAGVRCASVMLLLLKVCEGTNTSISLLTVHNTHLRVCTTPEEW